MVISSFTSKKTYLDIFPHVLIRAENLIKLRELYIYHLPLVSFTLLFTIFLMNISYHWVLHFGAKWRIDPQIISLLGATSRSFSCCFTAIISLNLSIWPKAFLSPVSNKGNSHMFFFSTFKVTLLIRVKKKTF